jgi:hypothetical protein
MTGMTTKHDWLAASTFEQTHEVVSAINTLSIRAKLLLEGVQDPAPAENVEQARCRIRAFLSRLRSLLDDSRGGSSVVGADPEMSEIALKLLSHGVRGRRGYQTPQLLVVLPNLIESDDEDDLRQLIVGLEELRSLVEVQTPSEPVQLGYR